MKFAILAAFFTFLGCETKPEKAFDHFVFSDSGSNHNYSILFSDSDTIYIEQRFPSLKHFYAVISPNDKDSVQSWVKAIARKSYQPFYIQHNVEDANEFQFFKKSGESTGSVYVYGHTAPEELFVYYRKFRTFKDIRLFETNLRKDFGNLDRFPANPPIPKMIK